MGACSAQPPRGITPRAGACRQAPIARRIASFRNEKRGTRRIAERTRAKPLPPRRAGFGQVDRKALGGRDVDRSRARLLARRRATETRRARRARVSPQVTVERSSRARVGKPPALWRAGTPSAFRSTRDQNGRLGADDHCRAITRTTSTWQSPRARTTIVTSNDDVAEQGSRACQDRQGIRASASSSCSPWIGSQSRSRQRHRTRADRWERAARPGPSVSARLVNSDGPAARRQRAGR